jgi:hypothetical protein
MVAGGLVKSPPLLTWEALRILRKGRSYRDSLEAGGLQGVSEVKRTKQVAVEPERAVPGSAALMHLRKRGTVVMDWRFQSEPRRGSISEVAAVVERMGLPAIR